MQAAITTLEIALDTLAHNEPINRAEGKVEQADFEKKQAEEIRRALATLKHVSQTAGRNPAEKDWQTEIHDSEIFINFRGQQAGILFPSPGFEMWHVNAAVATLNAYFPTEPAKR